MVRACSATPGAVAGDTSPSPGIYSEWTTMHTEMNLLTPTPLQLTQVEILRRLLQPDGPQPSFDLVRAALTAQPENPV